jgi:succinoglycan biosynthesis protein ExoO
VTNDTSIPVVSVIMANYNGEAHIEAAVRSVLGQTLASLELIVSDDASTDRSLERARAAARGDSRLRILTSEARLGPAAARNRAIAAARGDWLAIVDSDDLIHHERLERLVAGGERDGADIVADDQLIFYDDRSIAPHALLGRARARAPTAASAIDYVESDRIMSGKSGLGYLKPVIRRRAFTPRTLRYDESLRIAEDYDLVVRLLLEGGRMRINPGLWYFYRRHDRSISHRLKVDDLDAMLAAHDRQAAIVGDEPTREAMRRRRGSLSAVRAFCMLVDALKAKRFGAALRCAARRPAALWLLHRPLLDRLSRRSARRPAIEKSTAPRIALLSRQRVVGATNGSSAYVLALARALTDAGFAVDFIGASPKVFGRWPALKLKPETRAFDSYAVRGGLRTGSIIWSLDVRVVLQALLAAGAFGLAKLAPWVSARPKPADYSVAAPARRDDLLYVARHVRAGTCAVLCDYAFLAPLAPYALAFDAPVVTVMHDLHSARVTSDEHEATHAEVAKLTSKEEIRLLALADLVVAIQRDEEDEVRRRLPTIKTVVASYAADCVEAPQAGEDDRVLFVGSNTAPNVSGLNWFLTSCWPAVLAERPDAQLLVAGSVGRAVTTHARGVRMLGVVNRLDELYRDAGVVIAPLLSGSGLKIKVVEALAAGKAIVGTPVSAQGVAPIVEQAMMIETEPDAFAAAIAGLLADSAQRRPLAQAALECARTHFAPSTSYAPLIRSLNEALDRHRARMVA